MAPLLQLGDERVEVTFKDIRNVHLSVHPPAGRVTISAPRRMKLETVRLFAISKLDWIRRQQRKIRAQERESEREYRERESHYVWGQRRLLTLVEREAPPSISLRHNKLILSVRPGTPRKKRGDIIQAWYREQLKEAVPTLLQKWEPIFGVKLKRFFVQKMKTRWGSCNPAAKSIRLNTDLARKPAECLEYIVVHELVHLLEPTHNARFVALMDRFMPQWKTCRELLNRLPLRHDDWEY
jgi:predicted metal-dependent hydrolase